MKNIFQVEIENQFGFKIVKITPAPRQFVAETFFINTDGGNKYFVKIINKELFIPQIQKSLPILTAMKDIGVQNIAYPIKTKSEANSIIVENILIVVYEFVEGKQGYKYDYDSLGKINARVHQAIEKINIKVPMDNFDYEYRIQFEDRLQIFLQKDFKSEDQYLRLTSQLIQKYQTRIETQYKQFQNYIKDVKKIHSPMVITHGDSPGNVIIRTKYDLTLVDWDYILLSSPERDTWFFNEDHKYFIGYRKIFPKYRINKTFREYNILRRYFCGMNEYFDELFSNKSVSHKKNMYDDLNENLFNGWMVPYLKSIEND